MKHSTLNLKQHAPLKTIRTISLFIAVSSVLAACSDDDTVALSADTAQDVQGIWERSGYGLLLDINGSELTVYEATRATCYLRDSGSVAAFISDFPLVQADIDHLQLSESEHGIPAIFDRVDSLPVVCDSPISDSITEQFDHFWHTFNDYYAFFSERGVDWMAQYDQWRPTLSDQSTENDLMEALIGLVTPIDDSHVGLAFDGAGDFSPARPKGFLQVLVEEFETQTEVIDQQSYVGTVLNQWRTDLQANYLSAPFITLEGNHTDLIQWGLMRQNVGYLSINQFFTTLDASEASDVTVFDDAMDRALTDLADTSALIIDLRLSPGGRDAVSITIANRFADTERLAATKAARDYQGIGDSQSYTIRPSDRQNYQNPVILITSGFSVSATEAFTLLMRSLPQVTHLGEPTNGALSDLLEKELPNDWTFSLSNEVYRDADGEVFEAVGIAPDIAVPVLSKAARDRGEDSALNAAFDALALSNIIVQ
ncbi:MAG: S41 family peptidase [Granulosicoccus sp.]